MVYNQNMITTTKREGFTIVELLIVIVVIAVLVTIATVIYSGINSRATEARIAGEARQVKSQIEVDKSQRGRYADTSGEINNATGIQHADDVMVQYTAGSNGTTFCATLNFVNGGPAVNISSSSSGVQTGACSGHVASNPSADGLSWAQQLPANTPDGYGSWVAATMSPDGQRMAAGQWYGFTYASDDRGASWRKVTTSADAWYDIVVASSGLYLTSANNYYYKSSNFGVTGTQSSVSGVSVPYLAGSYDGSKLMLQDVANKRFYVSSDSGATWSFTSSHTPTISRPALSGDGTLAAGRSTSGNPMYLSQDLGNTWTPAPGSAFAGYSWADIALDSDGSTIFGLSIGSGNYGTIYRSTDSGSTWQQLSAAGNRRWRSISTSADGQYVIAVAPVDGVYVSFDGGSTWKKQTSLPEVSGRGTAISSDGKKFLVVGDGGGFVGTRP